MRTKTIKQNKQSESRFTLEQIGRELRKFYPPQENLSPELSALVARLEQQIMRRRRDRQWNEIEH
jgi:hypothetical protein